MNNDWRYDDDRLKLRGQVLQVLLTKFGSQTENHQPKYRTQFIYECAHDWVSQGHKTLFGVTTYFEAYYAKTDT